MQVRRIRDRVSWLGAVDWDRRLFDALIPLPDGTSYNAYLVRGSEKVALLDTVDPSMAQVLLSQLEEVERVDYLVSHHAEQDHSGTIPEILEMYPNARVVASPKGKELLGHHLKIGEDSFLSVEDGEEISLGDRTLRFIHTPWVHWPETMVTYVPEERMLFSCDFFGSHLATSDLYVEDEGRGYEAAKRYYAEIMMPFRRVIRRNLEKMEDCTIDVIAPSHGPLYDRPSFIIDAYEDWVSDEPKNRVVLPYISMHGSTRQMVEYLVSALVEKGITVHKFDLSVTDIGKLAITLVDAATIIIGTPTFHRGPHPDVLYAAYLANALRPKAAFASVIGSYGWRSQAVEQIAHQIGDLKMEILEPVLCEGLPDEDTCAALDTLALTIAEKHRERGLA